MQLSVLELLVKLKFSDMVHQVHAFDVKSLYNTVDCTISDG